MYCISRWKKRNNTNQRLHFNVSSRLIMHQWSDRVHIRVVREKNEKSSQGCQLEGENKWELQICSSSLIWQRVQIYFFTYWEPWNTRTVSQSATQSLKKKCVLQRYLRWISVERDCKWENHLKGFNNHLNGSIGCLRYSFVGRRWDKDINVRDIPEAESCGCLGW